VCGLTVDNYVDLDLSLHDGMSNCIRMLGINLVHSDLKVNDQIAIDDLNFSRVTSTTTDMT